MEIGTVVTTSTRRGPRPNDGPLQGLSPARASVLRTLSGGQAEPVTLAALTAATGLHANTVREHLDGLERAGLVRRLRATPVGRGRPPWLYESTGASRPPEPYAGLAAALAAAIHRSSDAPVEAAEAAGRQWGHDLARARGASPTGGARAARDGVLGMLAELGFAPDAGEAPGRPPAATAASPRGAGAAESGAGDSGTGAAAVGAAGKHGADVVRLTRCPLLQAAYRYPDVVCAVHLGVVRGALTEYGADPSGTDLIPFAEPGACRLVLGGARPPASPQAHLPPPTDAGSR